MSVWSSEGCVVDTNMTTREQVVCKCYHLTAFGGGVMPRPNTINFSTAFADFDIADNFVMLIIVLAVLSLYVALAIWVRGKDRRDVLRWSICPLDDNRYGQHYRVCVILECRDRPGKLGRF